MKRATDGKVIRRLGLSAKDFDDAKAPEEATVKKKLSAQARGLAGVLECEGDRARMEQLDDLMAKYGFGLVDTLVRVMLRERPPIEAGRWWEEFEERIKRMGGAA